MHSNNVRPLRTAKILHADAPGGPIVGWVAALDHQRGLIVDFPNNQSGPAVARSTVALSAAELRLACEQQQSVVLLFERGDPRLPIVVGLLQAIPSDAATAPLLQARPGPEPLGRSSQPDGAFRLEARLDGRTVVLAAEEEIRLCCGRSSITLRADGQIEIRGAQLLSHAGGVNRIRGGVVRIN